MGRLNGELRNYFEEGVNAFYFDGTSAHLAERLRELLGEPERLAKLDVGTPLATNPLGDFYSNPASLRPIPGNASQVIAVLVIVDVPLAATDAQIDSTVSRVRSQLAERDRLLLAYRDEDDRAPKGVPA